MTTSLRNRALIWAVPSVLGIALATGLTWPRTVDSEPAAQAPAQRHAQKWTKVSVELPTSQALFPPGNGADIANSQCLICHSAGMVLRQPPLTQNDWVGEINKMRNSFGAPLPADQVEALAEYLHTINGRQSERGPSAADGQGS
jgi:mono/diheme cytochrome c family protein